MGQLEELERVVHLNDRTRVSMLLDELVESFRRKREMERVLRRVAQAVLSTSNSGPDNGLGNDEATHYLVSSLTVNVARSELIAALARYINGEMEAAEVQDYLDSLGTMRSELDEATYDLIEVKDELDIPPKLVVSGERDMEVRKGGRIEAVYEIENVGNEDTSEVRIGLPDAEDLNVRPSSVDSIPAGESTRVRLVGRATNSMRTRLVANAESSFDSLEVTFRVVDRYGFLQDGIDRIRVLKGMLEGLELEAGRQGRETAEIPNGRRGGERSRGNDRGVQGLKNQLRLIEERLVDLRRDVEHRDAGRSPGDNQLSSAVRRLDGGVRTRLERLEVSRDISEFEVSRLVAELDLALGSLQMAREADV